MGEEEHEQRQETSLEVYLPEIYIICGLYIYI